MMLQPPPPPPPPPAIQALILKALQEEQFEELVKVVHSSEAQWTADFLFNRQLSPSSSDICMSRPQGAL